MQTYFTALINVFFFGSDLCCRDHNWSSAANGVTSADDARPWRRRWRVGWGDELGVRSEQCGRLVSEGPGGGARGEQITS